MSNPAIEPWVTDPAGRPLFPVIFEDADLLVINKPAGLVCHPTKGDDLSSLVSRVRLYLGAEVPQHLIHRLDRETSGVLVMAKSDTAMQGLRKRWENRSVEKEYLAIVHGHVEWDERTVDKPLAKDETSPVAVRDWVSDTGYASLTQFFVVERFENSHGKFTLLKVLPQTGRKHQIRIHLSWLGHPIVGDKLYGPDPLIYLRLVSGYFTPEDQKAMIFEFQSLHATALRFWWQDMRLVLKANLRPEIQNFINNGVATSRK